jgi:hypothetical protein
VTAHLGHLTLLYNEYEVRSSNRGQTVSDHYASAAHLSLLQRLLHNLKQNKYMPKLIEYNFFDSKKVLPFLTRYLTLKLPRPLKFLQTLYYTVLQNLNFAIDLI